MNNPYLLIPVGILTLLSYFVSHFLVRFGIITLSLHRKIWNVILLLTFLVTAVLGLFLVVQINYKLQWTIIDAILKWHVDFGIAMSFVAVFHFLWHWGYFAKLFKLTGKPERKENNPIQVELPSSPKLPYLIVLSGFTSIVTQVLLVREITTVFQGNELYMTWTICLWMLLTGAGVLFGTLINRQRTANTINRILLLLGILPIIILLLMDFFRNSVFLPGTLINPLQFLLAALLLLLPICFLNGLVYSVLINSTGRSEKSFVKVYSLEAIGSVIGGLFVSFLLVRWFSILQSMLLVLFISCIFLFYFNLKKFYLFFAVGTLICITISYFLPVDNLLKSRLFIHQKLLETTETLYGNITVCENAGEYSFFNNGSLLFTSENIVYSEEFVHYAMLQYNRPKNVLLVSGGVSGMVDEILKYTSVERIDYVEINPKLIEIAKKYIDFPGDKKISLIIDDGRRFIQNCKTRYDVIIFAVPNPTSLTFNRYYSFEFLNQVKQILSENGIIVFGLSPVGNYLSEEKIKTASSVYNTLGQVFENVIIIPGELDFYITSDAALNSKIAELAIGSGIQNYYVNPDYIDDLLIEQRQLFIQNNLDSRVKINTDMKPVPVFYYTLGFLSRFKGLSWYILVIPVVLLLIPLFFFRKASISVYMAGFTGASLEMMLIFTFQIFYGYVYSALGLIVAIFMAGLSVGALLGKTIKAIGKRILILSQIALVFLSLGFIGVWFLHESILNQVAPLLVFIVYTLILSIVSGFMYVICTRANDANTLKSAKLIYTADLTGSAAGALAVTVILIPTVGLINSSLIIAGLNAATILLNIFKK